MEKFFYLLPILCLVTPLHSIGILFPRQSETREVSNLDGLWKFSISPKETPDIGFTEQWYNSFHNEVRYYTLYKIIAHSSYDNRMSFDKYFICVLVD